MNIHSTAGNYYRSAAQVGIRQKVARRRSFDLPGGVLLWKAVAKVMLWGLPLVLGINLWCSTAIHSSRAQYQSLQQAITKLEKSNDDLEVQRKRLTSSVRVKIAAAEKLSLFEPTPEQIQQM